MSSKDKVLDKNERHFGKQRVKQRAPIFLKIKNVAIFHLS
jgi:hypothetical protein